MLEKTKSASSKKQRIDEIWNNIAESVESEMEEREWEQRRQERGLQNNNSMVNIEGNIKIEFRIPSQCDRSDVVDILKKKGIAISKQSMIKEKKDDYTTIKATLTGEQVSKIQEAAEGLAEAVKRGKVEKVERLIAQGADVNKADKYCRTPLMNAQILEDKKTSLQITKSLLKVEGIRFDPYSNGYTALHHAVSGVKSKNIVELLCFGGPGITSIARGGGDTPVSLAYRLPESEKKIMPLFALYGGFSTEEERESEESLDARRLLPPRSFSYPIGKDMDPSQLRPLDRELLDAVNALDASRIAELAEKGANVNVHNRFGITPLHIAIYRDNPDAVRALLKQPDINVNATTSNGTTALHLSSYINTNSRTNYHDSDYAENMMLLLEHPNIHWNQKNAAQHNPCEILVYGKKSRRYCSSGDKDALLFKCTALILSDLNKLHHSADKKESKFALNEEHSQILFDIISGKINYYPSNEFFESAHKLLYSNPRRNKEAVDPNFVEQIPYGTSSTEYFEHCFKLFYYPKLVRSGINEIMEYISNIKMEGIIEEKGIDLTESQKLFKVQELIGVHSKIYKVLESIDYNHSATRRGASLFSKERENMQKFIELSELVDEGKLRVNISPAQEIILQKMISNLLENHIESMKIHGERVPKHLKDMAALRGKSGTVQEM